MKLSNQINTRIRTARRSHRVSVYMDLVDPDDIDQIAGMLRGLACAINGFQAIDEMHNERFWTESPVVWPFFSSADAEYFCDCVQYFFADHILESLRVKPRRYIRRF